MTDIVERLRVRHAGLSVPPYATAIDKERAEAATEIETLRALLQQLIDNTSERDWYYNPPGLREAIMEKLDRD